MSRVLMGITDYAAHRAARGLAGGTHKAVQRAIESGRITPLRDDRGRVRVDPEVADIQWATKTDPAKSAATNGTKPLAPPPVSEAKLGADTGREGGGSEFWKAKTDREKAEAWKSQIEARKAAGELVTRASIEDAARLCARAVRDAVMGVPERLAPQLGLSIDQEQALAGALRTALDDSARLAEDKMRAALPAMHPETA